MNKLLAFAILFGCVLALASIAPEPSIDDTYPTTRYERCMVLYGDTVDEKLCEKEAQYSP